MDVSVQVSVPGMPKYQCRINLLHLDTCGSQTKVVFEDLSRGSHDSEPIPVWHVLENEHECHDSNNKHLTCRIRLWLVSIV